MLTGDFIPFQTDADKPVPWNEDKDNNWAGDTVVVSTPYKKPVTGNNNIIIAIAILLFIKMTQ